MPLPMKADTNAILKVVFCWLQLRSAKLNYLKWVSQIRHVHIMFVTIFTSFFLCMFLLSVYTLYTSYVHMYIFILVFYHSPDNDRSTFETLCFTMMWFLLLNGTILSCKIPVYDHFAATEYRNWLFFYSLPCMKDVLDDEYYITSTIPC